MWPERRHEPEETFTRKTGKTARWLPTWRTEESTIAMQIPRALGFMSFGCEPGPGHPDAGGRETTLQEVSL